METSPGMIASSTVVRVRRNRSRALEAKMQSQRLVEPGDHSRRQLSHTRPETQVALSVVTVSDGQSTLRR